MTKAQTVTANFINGKAQGETFQWDDILTVVKDSKARVKNWLSVRGVLAYFMQENVITRTTDIYTETYIVN